MSDKYKDSIYFGSGKLVVSTNLLVIQLFKKMGKTKTSSLIEEVFVLKSYRSKWNDFVNCSGMFFVVWRILL